MKIHFLDQDIAFPDPSLAHESGLLAVGGDLSVERLLLAYENGIFPWYSEEDPILWFSPDPRLVLFPEELKISKSLARKRRSGKFVPRLDTAFGEVIRRCATTKRDNQAGTWITEEMIGAYEKLHELGRAHSVETYQGEQLVGGLYGVALGKTFFGESMFHHASEASKVCLAKLAEVAGRNGFAFIDCQVHTPHLESMGALEIERARFLDLLEDGLAQPRTMDWKKET